MENVLKALFDFQRFDQNAELQHVIDSVHNAHARRQLELDEAEWIAAAGTPGVSQEIKKTEERKL